MRRIFAPALTHQPRGAMPYLFLHNAPLRQLITSGHHSLNLDDQTNLDADLLVLLRAAEIDSSPNLYLDVTILYAS